MSKKITNIIKMLQSPDNENWTVALGILEAEYKSTNEVSLMLCYQCGVPNKHFWKEHAPECYDKLCRALDCKDDKPTLYLSFTTLFTAIKTYHPPQETLQVLFDNYARFLTNQYCVNLGTVEIKFKNKTDE